MKIMSKILEDMRNEALEEGRMEGRMEGKREGKREGVLDTVRCLVADGTLSLEKIASIAGLSYDEVKAIAENK